MYLAKQNSSPTFSNKSQTYFIACQTQYITTKCVNHIVTKKQTSRHYLSITLHNKHLKTYHSSLSKDNLYDYKSDNVSILSIFLPCVQKVKFTYGVLYKALGNEEPVVPSVSKYSLKVGFTKVICQHG